ncbi:MAG: hypothetical protein A2Y72_06815 [Chloroflexi bacterium RBG_13_53_26]|nr:MAG: hypothetical protein A2Y72_06815 [Chloroflexi bacterium RBG_13_53_26]
MVELTPTQIMDIDTTADYSFLYDGLSKQSIDFHQALAELVDNAISAKRGDYFTIEILLEAKEEQIQVTVADDGKGISKDELQTTVLRLGGRGASPGLLNEHGFGLKNSLCLLTGNKRPFAIITADHETAALGLQWAVDGPFRPSMQARLAADGRWLKDLVLCKGSTGTRVSAMTTHDYFRTLYPRAKNLDILATRLAEHLGVFYRHWLSADPRNQIWLRWKHGSSAWRDIVVPAVKLPIKDDQQSFSIDVELDGIKAHGKYTIGAIDESKTQGDHPPFPLEIYYQHTERTQGVDVVVRNKVILTHQLEQLWLGQIRRRERNDFLGELVLEGGNFSTVNNKTDLDPHNPLWLAVKEQLNSRTELLPPKYSAGRDEVAIRDGLKDLLEQFETGSKAWVNYPVWSGTGVRADIIHEGPNSSWLDVYEIKDAPAAPQDVYQLIMYWDGLVNDGKTPRRGRLVAESAP